MENDPRLILGVFQMRAQQTISVIHTVRRGFKQALIYGPSQRSACIPLSCVGVHAVKGADIRRGIFAALRRIRIHIVEMCEILVVFQIPVKRIPMADDQVVVSSLHHTGSTQIDSDPQYA